MFLSFVGGVIVGFIAFPVLLIWAASTYERKLEEMSW